MKLLRVIEEYRKSDNKHIGQYKLDMDSKTIINVLNDLALNEDDYEDEIFDLHILSQNKV